MAACRQIQIDPYLLPNAKLFSKWIKILNIKANTLNVTKVKLGTSLKIADTGDNLLSRTQLVQAIISTINKWEITKLRTFFTTKDITIWTNQPPMGKIFFTNCTSDRGLVSKIYKEYKNVNIKKTNKFCHTLCQPSPVHKDGPQLNKCFCGRMKHSFHNKGIVGVCDRLIQIFLRNCHVNFYSGCTTLPFKQQRSVSLLLHILTSINCQSLYWS